MKSTADKNNLKVLLLTDSDAFAGTERHILDLAKGLRAQGVNVAVACPEPSLLGDSLEREGVPHVVIQKGGRFDRTAIHLLRDLLVSGKFDILHSHNGRTAWIAALAVRSARRGFLVATQHFISPNQIPDAFHSGITICSPAVHPWGKISPAANGYPRRRSCCFGIDSVTDHARRGPPKFRRYRRPAAS